VAWTRRSGEGAINIHWEEFRLFAGRNIRQIGIVIELEDGEQVVVHGTSPGMEVTKETRTEQIQAFGSNRVIRTHTHTTLTIEGFNEYTLYQGDTMHTPPMPELDGPSNDVIE